MQTLFWIVIILAVLVFAWYRFMKQKRSRIQSEVFNLLNNELNIDTNHQTNKKFIGPLVYLDIIEEGMMKNKNAHEMALLITMEYWTGILNRQMEGGIQEAKLLKPNILVFLNNSISSGKLNPGSKIKVEEMLNSYSERFKLKY